jgi:hypothetical protein
MIAIVQISTDSSFVDYEGFLPVAPAHLDMPKFEHFLETKILERCKGRR